MEKTVTKYYKVSDSLGTRVMTESELREFTEMICRICDVDSIEDTYIECREIRNPMDATDLSDLHEIILNWDDVENWDEYFEPSELPTFGGDEPRDTSGIWSWDETGMIIGTCFSDFEIVDRN